LILLKSVSCFLSITADEADHESSDLIAASQQQIAIATPLLPVQDQNRNQPMAQQHIPNSVPRQTHRQSPVRSTIADVPIQQSAFNTSQPLQSYSNNTSCVTERNSNGIADGWRQVQVTPQNPYQRTNTSISMSLSNPSASTTSSISNETSASHAVSLARSQYSATAMPSSATVIASVQITEPTVRSNQMTSQRDVITSANSASQVPSRIVPTFGSGAVVVSFPQLRDLLLRAIESEAIYRHTFGQLYIVHNMKQSGPKLYFNIEKNKSKKRYEIKSKGDKVCHF
jgi:hypothetical protein